MGNAKRTLVELGSDMGFSFNDGELVLSVGNSDLSAMRSDIQRIGQDMRKVINQRI